MKDKRKSIKVLSVILSAFMLVSMLPMFVFAGNTDPIEITAQPENISATAGEEMSTTVVATNATSYQWQRSGDGQTWAKIDARNSNYSGTTTDTLTVKVSNGTAEFVYRCVLKNSECTETTDTVTVTVDKSLTIVNQPESISALAGEEKSTTVTATNATSYDWQRSSDGQTWSNIGSTNNNYSGVKTKTLTVKVNNGTAAFVYRCVVKNSECSEPTDVVTVSVEKSLKIAKQPENISDLAGEEKSTTVVATNVTSYEWQRSGDGQTWAKIDARNSNYSGTTTDTLTVKVSNGTAGFVYRCVLKNSECTETTDTVTVTVDKSLTIVNQPESISALAGEEMSTTVVATNATSYQWQRSGDGQTWANIGSTNNNYSGVKTKTLTVKVNNGTAAFVYRCVVKNSECSEPTDVVTVSVEKSLKITKQPENISDLAGEEKSTTVTATNATSYEWQRSSDGQTWSNIGSTNNNYSGVKTKTLTVKVNNGTAAFVYRCVVKNSECSEPTDVVTVSVEKSLKIAKQPESIDAAVGEEMSTTVVAKNATSYEWQRSGDGQTWAKIDARNSNYSGTTTDTLTVKVSNGTAGFVYRCVMKNSECTVYSDVVVVSVAPSIVVVSQPESIDGAVGEEVGTTVSATNVTSYQWQRSTDGENWGNISSANSNYSGTTTNTLTVKVSNGTAGFVYRCVMKNSECTVNSDVVEVTVNKDIILRTVTFNANGGYFCGDASLTELSSKIREGAAIDAFEMPENDVYAFEGWYLDPECKQHVDTLEYVVTGDVTLYAKWSEGVKVTLNANGGSFETGEKIELSLPVGSWILEYGFFAPERSGYVVDGWYKDPACTEAVDLDTYIVNENVTIYAHWIEAVTLTWNANGGAFYIAEGLASSVCTQDVPLNEVVINMGQDCIPERPGYAFAGWYSDQACTKAVYLDYYVALFDDTFYAKWVPGCQVTWNANGGSFFGLEDIVTITEILPKNEGIDSYYMPELNGKVFVGWYSDAKCQNAVDIENYTLTSNVTFYAKWADPVEITWDANGGYLDGDLNNTLWIDVVAKDEVCALYYYPERENHTFEGWCVDPDCKTIVDLDTYIVTEDVTFYAKWNNSVTITWNSNGGYSEESGSSILVEQFPKGQELQYWVAFEKDNLILEGWYLDQALTWRLPMNYVVNQSVTLYAKWAEPVTIRWEANGGYLQGDPDLGSYEEILPKDQYISNPPTVSREESVFVGWYLDPNFSKAEDIYDYAPSQDTVFYAKWRSGIAVTFDANGGIIPTTGTETEVDYILNGEAIKGEPIPTRDNYKFVEWCLDPDCTISVKPISFVPTEDITFYAKWVESIYVTFDANGGIVYGQPTYDIPRKAGEAIPDIPATRVNDVFEGWYYDLGFTQPVPKGALIYENTTIYAKWASSDAQVACEDIEIQLILHGHLITGVSVEPDATQAEFGLYSDAACTKLIATTSISGTTTIEGVPVYTAKFDGSKLSPETTYYIKQTKGVSGFSVDQGVIKVTFDSEGEATYTNETLGITIIAAQFSNKFDLNQSPAISG